MDTILETTANELLRYNKIELDMRNEKLNKRTLIVQIEKFKKYAKIVKCFGKVVSITYAQNELALLLKN
jgi:hypothetical protein